jgi:RND superfamily putative drug exporter
MSIRISPGRIGRWSASHPWRALLIWAAFVAACVALGAAAGTSTLSDGAVGESARGNAVMNQQGLWGPPREYAYLHSSTLVSTDPGFAAAVQDVARRIAAPGLTVSATTSADRHSVLVSASPRQPTGPATASELLAARARIQALAAARPMYPGLTIAETGDISANDAQNRIVNGNMHRVGLLAIPVTLLVLLLAFGSLVAAVVPLLLGLTAVAAGLGLLGPLSHLFPVQDSAKTVILLIGLAVGVDYALFYVVRCRQERRAGATQRKALETTSRTSGRTVVISGSTVALAVAGLFIPGLKVLNGIAVGTIAVIACAVAGSVTVLPAVLTLLGPKIDAGRIGLPRRVRGHGGRFWPWLTGRVLHRPATAASLATTLLLVLAAPAISLHMAQPSPIALTAPDDPALRTLAAIQRTFPGADEPAYVAVQAPASARGALTRDLTRLQTLAASHRIAHPPFQLTWNTAHTAAALRLPLTGDSANPPSRQAVQTLRHTLVPETIGHVPGAHAYVTGATAGDIDFTSAVRGGLPYAIAFVLVLAFCLLTVAFRSVIVPLTTVALNLLSVTAAYGLLVLVFQHRWAEPVLHFRSNGTITSWLPLFLFVILFGLSMDYHVFVLSRIQEAVTGGEPAGTAIRRSIRRTAAVITAAALVMVCVFALFGTLSSLDLKQAGVGLAAAVLIDATVIRSVLLPATMALLGERNWYLPRWLAWLPRVGLEDPAGRGQASTPGPGPAGARHSGLTPAGRPAAVADLSAGLAARGRGNPWSATVQRPTRQTRQPIWPPPMTRRAPTARLPG